MGSTVYHFAPAYLGKYLFCVCFAEDDPNRSGRLPVLPTHTTDRPDHTTEEPASGRGEMSTPAEKRRRTEEEKHSEGSETAELPESQEELRRRRLKHLEQNKSHLN